jgi:hypothetical protein
MPPLLTIHSSHHRSNSHLHYNHHIHTCLLRLQQPTNRLIPIKFSIMPVHPNADTCAICAEAYSAEHLPITITACGRIFCEPYIEDWMDSYNDMHLHCPYYWTSMFPVQQVQVQLPFVRAQVQQAPVHQAPVPAQQAVAFHRAPVPQAPVNHA